MSDPRDQGVVIVGGGLAAIRTAEQLRAAEFTCPVTIVSDEAHLPYDSPPLSKNVLRGEGRGRSLGCSRRGVHRRCRSRLDGTWGGYCN